MNTGKRNDEHVKGDHGNFGDVSRKRKKGQF